MKNFVASNVDVAPYACFGLLLLAGFNIPVSEDLLVLASAVAAAENAETHSWVPLFMGVFWGGWVSDLICFSLGYFFGEKIMKIKFFASMITKEKLDKMNHFYSKYGMMTLILGRFVPFGVRNALFLTAGIGKMKPAKFALADFIACCITIGLYFYLYYTFGDDIQDTIKDAGVIIFAVFICIILFFVFKKILTKKQPS